MRTSSLPPAIERPVRMASVAPHLREMFAHLPQAIGIDADLPSADVELPVAARQLLKLPLVGDRVRFGAITVGRPLRLSLSLGERRCVLEGEELAGDVRAIARRVLSSLFAGSDVARVLEGFAFQSSSLAMLQRITSRMLQTTDVDRALDVMLSGITSGYGLGFNRAALFVHDEARGTFVGTKAVGPADEAEAHRIWEELELEDKTLDQTIEDALHRRFDTRFEERIASLELAPQAGAGAQDEVGRALAEPAPVHTTGAPENPSLAPLDAQCGFVLAAVRAHGRVLGLVFADNRWAGTGVTLEQREHFAFFIDQTALVWENLLLFQRVEGLARSDALTGVWNRRELDARLESEASRCQRSGGGASLLVIDVDRFKEINDTGGHEAGDAVLKKLGALMRQHVREHDVVARLGGDEFVVLLPDATHEHLVGAAKRLGALASDEGISLSIGGASFPGDAADMHALIGAADAQLYAAKRAGRGCAFVLGERIDYPSPASARLQRPT